MLQDGTYNYRVHLPQEHLPTGQILPVYTHHARQQAKEDKYGNIELPQVIDLSVMRIDEVEVVNGKVHKIVCRKPLDALRDFTLVLVPITRKVITVWSNLNTDQHHSTNLDKYVRP